MVSLQNLQEALKAVGVLGLGTGIAGVFSMISVILVSVFAQQVAIGNIPVTSAANTTIQTMSSTIIAANVIIVGLLSLVAGLASLVIIVLALLGKVDFAQAAGVKGKGNKMF